MNKDYFLNHVTERLWEAGRTHHEIFQGLPTPESGRGADYVGYPKDRVAAIAFISTFRDLTNELLGMSVETVSDETVLKLVSTFQSRTNSARKDKHTDTAQMYGKICDVVADVAINGCKIDAASVIAARKAPKDHTLAKLDGFVLAANSPATKVVGAGEPVGKVQADLAAIMIDRL